VNTVEAYVAKVVDACRRVVGPELAGVYLCGSAANGETGLKSDIDLIAVARSGLSQGQKQDLAAALDHAALPVPASALEIIFVTAATAKHPPRNPEMEFALTTGAGLTPETQEGAGYAELLIDLAACREHGRAMLGPPPDAALGTADRRCLLEAMIQNLEWHRTAILDPYHDPLGQNSVLNAARTWCVAEAGRLVSKAEGGRWVMGRDPLAAAALAVRSGARLEPLERDKIDALLQKVINVCRAAQI
jgi:predicted nucleotidyltransferase